MRTDIVRDHFRSLLQEDALLELVDSIVQNQLATERCHTVQ